MLLIMFSPCLPDSFMFSSLVLEWGPELIPWVLWISVYKDNLLPLLNKEALSSIARICPFFKRSWKSTFFCEISWLMNVINLKLFTLCGLNIARMWASNLQHLLEGTQKYRYRRILSQQLGKTSFLPSPKLKKIF